MFRASLPTLENCIRHVENHPDTFFPLFSEQTQFEPGMPERIEKLIPLCGNRKRAQLFLYIMWGVKTLERMSTNTEAPFPYETPEDEEVLYLERQIAEMHWDCKKIHSLLFDLPRKFTYHQVWILAAAMIRSYYTGLNRRLAFGMGLQPRLGHESLVLGLHADAVRLIMRHL